LTAKRAKESKKIQVLPAILNLAGMVAQSAEIAPLQTA
jgi:hypothetical protein